MNIPITKTKFTEKEISSILSPLKSGQIEQGQYVAELEKEWSEFTSIKNSIAVANCTSALHISLAALGVGYKDEVIIPSFTSVSTANAVEATGAKPIFCDIDLRTFNIDTKEIESLMSNKTVAIIPVHLFGLPANMDEVIKFASEDSIFVVEDAACGFGSRYKGKHVGRFGDTGCFSLNENSVINTGEGGMITVTDKLLAEKIRAMRENGATVSDHQLQFGDKPYLMPEFQYLGFNSRMTELQASLGSTQMDRADYYHKRRLEIAAMYDELFKDIEWLERPFRNKDFEHGFQSYVCLFKPEEITINKVHEINKKRNDFMDYLQLQGIASRPGTHAVHMLGYYAKKYRLKPKDYPNSWFANHCSIAFPIYPTLSDNEFDYISDKIKKYEFKF